jgi:hypothetical protein
MASASFLGPFSPTIARIPQLRPVPVRQRSIIKVDENDEIALRRMVAGRGILRNHGRNNNSPETGPETPDDALWFGNWLALTNPLENVSAIRQTGRFSSPPESGWKGKSQCDLSGAAVIACPGILGIAQAERCVILVRVIVHCHFPRRLRPAPSQLK